jgi:L-glutamine-phosphate cytidylyltransferase
MEPHHSSHCKVPGSSIVRVIILAAGQGKRLLPLTAEVPKAMLDIGGKPLIGRQIEAFTQCGVKDFVVVTGYATQRVEAMLAELARHLDVSVRCVFNPFYGVADNLASCWLARSEMASDFIQVNGDNVFKADLVERLLSAPRQAVSVAINRKREFDADDMKVMLDGERLTEIGKTLPADTVDAEAVGFYVFRDGGAHAYVRQLEEAIQDPEALRRWFPSVVGALAKKMEVHTISITGLEWSEVDFPVDLQKARQLVANWS